MRQHSATDRIFLRDSYIKRFDATVLSCEPTDDGRFRVVLDRTGFYPESGGQLPDRGRMGKASVQDVGEVGEVVFHTIDRAVEPGPTECEVNWERRFDHMQQHTGQHVLSRAFIDVAELDTVSFHMGDEHCSIDLTGSFPNDHIIEQAETLANHIIHENRAIRVRTLVPHDVNEPLLRKALPDDVHEIRLVEVADFDVIGCCGTHVRHTGELGVIKVLKTEKAKGNCRVFFKVGRRALDDYRLKHDVVSVLAARLTTGVDVLAERVDAVVAELKAQKKSNRTLSLQLAVREAEQIVADAEVVNGCRFVSRVVDGGAAEAQAMASALAAHPGVVCVIAARDGSIVCNGAQDVAADIAGVIAPLMKDVGARGGGKGLLVNVKLPAGADASAFVSNALTRLRQTCRITSRE